MNFEQHVQGRLDELESEVREIQKRIAEMRADQDSQGRAVENLGSKLDDLAEGYRDGQARVEVALHKHEDVMIRVAERLDSIETDVGAAKKWLSKVWPMLAALFAGAAGGDSLIEAIKALLR